MDHQPSFDQVPLKSLDGREHQFDERSTVRGRKPRWQLFGGLGERVLPASSGRSTSSRGSLTIHVTTIPEQEDDERLWRDNLDERRATIKLRMSRQK